MSNKILIVALVLALIVIALTVCITLRQSKEVKKEESLISQPETKEDQKSPPGSPDSYRGAGVPAAPNDGLVTANVLGYGILNSRVETIQPEQVLYALWLELLRSEDVPGLPNFTRHHVGEIIKVLSKEALSPDLFGKTIQAHVEFIGDERGGKFWIRNISVLASQRE